MGQAINPPFLPGADCPQMLSACALVQRSTKEKEEDSLVA